MASDKKPRLLSDNFMFPKLFQAFRMAVQPGKLIVALMGLIVICLAGYLMDLSGTVVVSSAGQEAISELDVYLKVDMASPSPGQTVSEFRQKHLAKGARTGVFSTLWNFGSKKFHDAIRNLFDMNFATMAENIADYFKGVAWAMRFHYAYCLVFVVIKLAVFSVIGGALCRMAALQFARGERTGIIEALRFGVKRFTSFFFAPLLPVIAIGIIAGFILLLGLAAKTPYLGVIFMIFILILGAFMAIAIIGTTAGFNLMFPAVAYDGADAFDSVSRSFSYVFSRPWRMGFYTLTAAMHGAICYVFVRLFASLMLLTIHLLASAAVGVAEWIVTALVISIIISYYFSANTIIYSLMRNKVDNAALNEIHQDAKEPGSDSIATLARP